MTRGSMHVLPAVAGARPALDNLGGEELPVVRVWLGRAVVEPAAVDSGLLSPAERRLVVARRQPPDRQRSATARVLLKLLLEEEFGVDPWTASLLPPAGAGGKPELVHAPVPGLREPLRANVSHAGSQVLVALTQGASIGVDVEEHQATGFAGFDAIALSAMEREVVAALPEPLRAQRRAEFWVRKEAVLKALGTGLLLDPARLCFAHTGAQSLAQLPGHPPVAVQLLRAPPGHSAALAVGGARAVERHETSFSAPQWHITQEKHGPLESKDRLC